MASKAEQASTIAEVRQRMLNRVASGRFRYTVFEDDSVAAKVAELDDVAEQLARREQALLAVIHGERRAEKRLADDPEAIAAREDNATALSNLRDLIASNRDQRDELVASAPSFEVVFAKLTGPALQALEDEFAANHPSPTAADWARLAHKVAAASYIHTLSEGQDVGLSWDDMVGAVLGWGDQDAMAGAVFTWQRTPTAFPTSRRN